MRQVSVLLLALCACGVGEPPAAVRPNVLFVLIDTLRFDHLSVYGYERPTSPNIDALAARGWIFDRQVSQAAQTVPSTLSVLLSQLPAEHGFVHRVEGQFSQRPPHYPQRFLFLAEVLRNAGYRTGGFVGNPFLGRKNGFDQGFDRFLHAVKDDRQLVDAAVSFVRATERDRPFFAYVHLFDVHWPYRPPQEYRVAIGEMRQGRLVYKNGLAPNVTPLDLARTEATYDAGIRYADALVGELLDAVETAGAADRTLVVVTSDHGEEFLEHGGLGHGTAVYGEQVRVPLIFFDPREPGHGSRIERVTSGLDVAPTLLDRIGVPRPETFRGGDLFAGDQEAFTEALELRAVYSGGFKLIRDLEHGGETLFEGADALDRHEIEGNETTRVSLARRLDAYLALERSRANVVPEGEAGEAWSEAELERLRALGYAH